MHNSLFGFDLVTHRYFEEIRSQDNPAPRLGGRRATQMIGRKISLFSIGNWRGVEQTRNIVATKMWQNVQSPEENCRRGKASSPGVNNSFAFRSTSIP
ncbi:MAG: hypothetical protein HY043_07275 [Verrucomicrobia bacterium]|nr:hypothetical protein [Verrucomicrobiota bacterium]